jgi:hypothetical protein
MGYPFDRLPRTGAVTLQTFLTPNMGVQDVSIQFNDITEDNTGSNNGSPRRPLVPGVDQPRPQQGTNAVRPVQQNTKPRPKQRPPNRRPSFIDNVATDFSSLFDNNNPQNRGFPTSGRIQFPNWAQQNGGNNRWY